MPEELVVFLFELGGIELVDFASLDVEHQEAPAQGDEQQVVLFLGTIDVPDLGRALVNFQHRILQWLPNDSCRRGGAAYRDGKREWKSRLEVQEHASTPSAPACAA